MKVTVELTKADKRRWKNLWELINSEIQIKREIRNRLKIRKKCPSDQEIWDALVIGLVTSQQKSGKNSVVNLFLKEIRKREQFNLQRLCNRPELIEEIHYFEKLRFNKKIYEFMTDALDKYRNDHWKTIKSAFKDLMKGTPNLTKEREVANQLQTYFKGIGLKQSRNILQSLHLSRYMIPLDSKVMGILKSMNNGKSLVGTIALQDQIIYIEVENTINDLCEDLKVLPCYFDGVLFYHTDEIEELISGFLIS